MNKIICLLIGILTGVTAFGQSARFRPDKYSTKINSSDLALLSIPYDLAQTQPDTWPSVTGIWKFKSIDDNVKIGIRRDILVASAAYRYQVSLSIKCYRAAAPTVLADTRTVTLEISYDPAALVSYKDLAVYKFNGFGAIQVKINSITRINPGGSLTVLTAAAIERNFFIESEVVIQRYDLDKKVVTRSDLSLDTRSLAVKWGVFNSGTAPACPLPVSAVSEAYKPVSYELEWCYIDDYQYDITTNTTTYGFVPAPAALKYDFRSNSTRIQTNAQSFNIPLIYEHGALLFRVRTVRPSVTNFKDLEYGPWSIPADYGTVDATASCFIGQGYIISNAYAADSLNWQYTINFAEDGKYKHVINYFDGSLKDRQTQTKINTDTNYIIAVDKVYDYEGRPAIVTLPTPVLNQGSLYYRRDVSTHKTTNTSYRAADFDILGCVKPDSIAPLADLAVANQYYSPANPDKTGMQQFVPDAKGYPMVQTVYSADNTNKVLWQGAAGRELQLWKNHGTRYEYTRPIQRDIDRLLGTEAGKSSYYPKQVVTDPNGQSSFSIMDPSGKVVISGLQGPVPDTTQMPLDTLTNYVRSQSVCENLLEGYSQDRSSDGLSAQLPIYNDNKGDVTFKYSIRTYPYFTGCSGQYLWSPAAYAMNVTNDCGTVITSSAATVGERKASNANGSSYTVTSPVLSVPGMDKGNYLVNKKVSFSAYDIRSLVDSFVFANEPTCYNDVNYFIKKAVDSSIFPCEGGSGVDSTPCQRLRRQMMQELYPGAKYGQYTKDSNGLFMAGAANSIFTQFHRTIDTNNAPPADIYHYIARVGWDVPMTNILPVGTIDPVWQHSWDGTGTDYRDTKDLLNPTPAVEPIGDTYSPTYILSASNYGGFDYYRGIVYVDESLPLGAVYAIGAVGDVFDSLIVNGVVNKVKGGGFFGENFDVKGFHYGANEVIWAATNDIMDTIPVTVPDGRSLYRCNTTSLAGAIVVYDTIVYRYQDRCVQLPDSVFKNGIVYTNLRSLAPQTFINIFNDEIAEALLPLHPEYCKLLNCDGGNFEQQLEETISFQQAETNNMFLLDSLVVHDPLAVSAPGGAARLKYLAGMGTTRLDVLALKQAYCAAGNAEEQAYCAANNYKYQIDHFLFVSDAVKQMYFDNLKALYTGNRGLILQGKLDSSGSSCLACNTVRMTLSGAPVFPSVDDALAGGTGSGSGADDALLPDWMRELFRKARAGDTTGMSSVPGPLKDSLAAMDLVFAETQADALMDHLANCSLDSAVLDRMRAAAINVLMSGRDLSPAIVSAIITDTVSLSLSDLCHPFLVSYKLLPDTRSLSTSYACGSTALYDGLLSFLQRPEVLAEITTAPAAASPSATTGSGAFPLSGSNAFETTFGSSATVTAYTESLSPGCTDCFVSLVISGTLKTDTLNITAQSFGTTPDLKTALNSSAPVYNLSAVACLNEDPAASATGLIAQQTAVLRASCTGCASPVSYYIWSRHTPFMDPAPAAASLGNCVTCLDIKAALIDFKADKAVYQYSEATNHPLFTYTLTNYLNVKLNKSYGYSDYAALMEGCAVTDQVALLKIIADYRIEFNNESDANALVNTINNYGTYLPDYLRYKTSGGNHILFIDFSGLPEDTLLAYKLLLDGVSALSKTYAYTPSDNNTSFLFSPAACTFTPSSFAPLYNTDDVSVWEADDYTPGYKLHTFRQLPGATARQEADMLAAVNTYLHVTSLATAPICNSGYAFAGRELLRSSDYSTTLKQQYLAYIYGLSGTHAAVVAAIDPSVLGSQLAGYSGSTFTYDDPYCQGSRTHLYAYNPNPSPLPAGYNLVKNTILNTVGSTLFPNADFTYKAPLGSRLAVIRKANGDYWYRYFDAANKLYNVYITPPSGLMAVPPAAYSFAVSSTRMGPHPNTFTVDVTYGGTTVRCSGHADFSLGNSVVAENVILDKSPAGVYCTDTMDCEYNVLARAVLNGKSAYQRYFDSTVDRMSNDMMTHLLNTTRDSLVYCGQQQQYQQTLYYYDLAGNLARTVPPAGIVPVADASLPLVKTNRDGAGTGVKMTDHKKISSYTYNALNQLIYQKTPDGGTVYFFYDAAGRQIFSQNSKQRMDGKYTYSLYDKQGRAKESGIVKLGCTYPAGSVDFDTTYCSFYLRNSSSGTTELSAHPDFIRYSYDENSYPYDTLVKYIHSRQREEVVISYYDTMTKDLGALAGQMLNTQENLRSRVSAISYYPLVSSDAAYVSAPFPDPFFATYYSYDISGNVQTLTYDFFRLKDYDQRYKRVDYDYDLVSGKVNMISYNRGRPDQFYQQYDYDADNRITQANTSNDGLTWNKDARYSYYKHGPLATLKLGEQLLQSLEYAYTIQGWLKAINGDLLRNDKDMGLNGGAADVTYARDVINHALQYYPNDYAPVGSTAVTSLPATTKGLYNGNIVQQTTGISGLGNMQRTYRYDQLQRLKLGTNVRVTDATASLDATTPANLYRNSYTYDMDGNIKTLERYEGSATPLKIDQLSYNYEAGNNNNRLLQVQDAGVASANTDLKTGQPADNYAYDRTGNLVRDKQGAEIIQWDRFGKVKNIRDTVSQRYITFEYDGKGNRIWKEVTNRNGTAEDRLGEYYVRDAGGNLLSVYNTHSAYSKSVWMSNMTATISKTALSPILAGYMDRSLSTKLINLLLTGHSSWYNTYTTSGKPLSYYLSVDPTLKNNLITSGMDWIDALRTSNATFYRNAFLAAGGSSDMRTMIEVPFGFTSTRQPLITLLYNNFPAASLTTVWSSIGATYVAGNLTQSMQNLETALLPGGTLNTTRRATLTTAVMNMIVGYINTGATYPSTFYTQMIAENTLWQSDKLRGVNGTWTSSIRTLTNTYGDNTQFQSFFNSWSGAAPALAACTSPDYKLRTLYNLNPAWTFNDMLAEATTADITSILSAMDDLTTAELSNALVAAGTIDPYAVMNLWNNIGDTMTLGEHHIYGSSRIGVQRYDNTDTTIRAYTSGVNKKFNLSKHLPWYSYSFEGNVDSSKTDPYGKAGNPDTITFANTRTLGRRYYELTDHLGNVLATVLDRKTGHLPTAGATFYDYWTADIASSTDYYPYGMPMPGRTTEASWSRHGYNGQAKDDEVYGKGNLNSALHWEYDTRLGPNGRWNTDPVVNPSVSPYATFEGNPIWKNDVLGNDPDNFVFNEKGNFQKIEANNQPDRLVIQNSESGERNYYQFADPKSDAQQIRDGIINKVVTVSKGDITNLLQKQGAFNSDTKGSYRSFYKNSKGGQPFDYSITVIRQVFAKVGASQDPLNQPSPMLFLPEGDYTVHNHMNFGNYLWAASGYSQGFDYAELKWGAHANSLINPGANGYKPQLDSKDDQLSITLGAYYAAKNKFRDIVENDKKSKEKTK